MSNGRLGGRGLATAPRRKQTLVTARFGSPRVGGRQNGGNARQRLYPGQQETLEVNEVPATTVTRRELINRFAFGKSDLLEYAPVSRGHAKDGRMTLADVCAAAVQWSDNTAANLMLRIVDGPAGLTQFIRSLGDSLTRLDRIEPELNVVAPGEVRDTSSPAAMVKLLSTVLFGQVLSMTSRAQLQTWMLEAKVGENRLPAGLQAGWRIAHKTGTWSTETNDVGVIWPPGRAPIVIAAFYNHAEGSNGPHEAVLRDVARVVAEGARRE